jgi:hypothetical protein
VVWLVNPETLTCGIQQLIDEAPVPVTAFTDERLLKGLSITTEQIFLADLRRIIEEA